MDVIESLSGMVTNMLEFPLVGFLGRLVPAGGSEAGQQVATVVGAGLDNLGSLCSQAGLDRWELLGLAVLSAITVYRKELSSNSVYNGKRGRNGGGGSCGGGGRYHQTGNSGGATVVHVDGCHVAAAAAAAAASTSSETTVAAAEVSEDQAVKDAPAATPATEACKPCTCARISALQRQRASAARRLRADEDERKIKAFVAGRIRSLDLPVNHLQQLRASMDASWSSISTAWESRRTKSNVGGNGGSGGRDSGVSESTRQRATTAPLPGCSPPRCSRHASSPRPLAAATPISSPEGGGEQRRPRQAAERPHEGDASGGVVTKDKEECTDCAAIAATHAAAAAFLGSSGTGGESGMLLLHGQYATAEDLWAGAPLGVLPTDVLHRAATFLPPQDLLSLAQVSKGGREAADSQLVWREVWWARFGAVWESEICRKAAQRWHLHGWDPKSSAVTQGWKDFFFEFQASWLEWLAAGQNLESSCLVGVHGRLYDITEFMHRHPGSPETLMDNAGRDASSFFEDVGHSLNARDLMKSLDSLAPGPGSCGGSTSPSRSSSRNGSISSGDPRVGACMLSSTAQRLRKGRALARREAKAVHAAAAAAAVLEAAGGAPLVSPAATAAAAAAPAAPAGIQEFVCDECEEAFEPTDLDGDGEAGRQRRSRCPGHINGDLHVFYSPVRGEWGGFYSCCRQHVCFCITAEH